MSLIGHGILSTQILRLNPHLKATSFDLVCKADLHSHIYVIQQPHVTAEANAKKIVENGDVASRLEYAAGSFFETIPAGGGMLIMNYFPLTPFRYVHPQDNYS